MLVKPTDQGWDVAAGQAPLGFARRFGWWIILLIFVSLVSSLQDIRLYAIGQYTDFQVTSPLRLLREGAYFLLLADFGILLWRCRNADWFSYSALSLWSVITAFVVGEAMYSATIGLPWIVIVAGLRIFEYLPLVFIAATVYRIAGVAPFRTIARALVVYLLIQSAAGAIEITLLPRVFGFRTRAYGTLPGPIVFGITVVVCLLFAMLARLRPLWPMFVISGAMSVASGTRMAMLMVVASLSYGLLERAKDLYSRLGLVLAGLLAAPLVFLASNLPIFAARYDPTGGFQRLEVWGRIAATIHTVPDLLFGWGMGLGSNTVFSLLGAYGFPGQYIADGLIPFILGSYGVNGVLLELTILLIYLWRVRHSLDGIAVLAFFSLASLTTVVLEVFPVNAIMLVLLGWFWAERTHVTAFLRQQTAEEPIGTARPLAEIGWDTSASLIHD